ncbi:hypothetical protein [Aquirufa ecclesiirivi]|uniref:hypothetical protein n=1 Tax=Aquirufa ecclesiirivi TaxID=2715124 RepID=UPI00140AF37B|nr:hypothetical protein [Aquirufa ecclesiirivi]NHC49554.1 hypothetical protein [Aquirufa ecclesiirivi]
MKKKVLLNDDTNSPDLKKWESPKLEKWNTEEIINLNPLKFLLDSDHMLGY